MKFVFLMLAAFAGLVWWMLHGEPEYTETLIAHMPIADKSGMKADVKRVSHTIDYQTTADGNGSLRIDASGPTFVNLFDIWGEQADLSFQQLLYEAKVKTENATGPVFLVMQAGVSGAPGGSMPVIGRDKAISGTNDWTTMQIWAGNPAGTQHLTTTLQLEISGAGTVWIDDVKLIRRRAR